LVLPWQAPEGRSSCHLYVVRVDAARSTVPRGKLFALLRQEEIGVNVHYIPVHTQPYYRQLGFREEQFPESVRYYKEALSLPIYAGMSEEQQDRVVEVLKRGLL